MKNHRYGRGRDTDRGTAFGDQLPVCADRETPPKGDLPAGIRIRDRPTRESPERRDLPHEQSDIRDGQEHVIRRQERPEADLAGIPVPGRCPVRILVGTHRAEAHRTGW